MHYCKKKFTTRSKRPKFLFLEQNGGMGVIGVNYYLINFFPVQNGEFSETLSVNLQKHNDLISIHHLNLS